MSGNSSIFDMLGPVMIGPSSSHTAGVVRIGRVAIRLLGGKPKKANIYFYNSFSKTYEGHGSDRAVIAGLLDFKVDDERIKNSFEYAKKIGLAYSFHSISNASTFHPNTIRLELEKNDKKLKIIGISTGGGMISISEFDGFKANISATLHTLVIKANDTKGSIASISLILSHDECNIATMNVSRVAKNNLACLVIEVDSAIKKSTVTYLNSLNWVREVIYIPNIDI